MKPLIYLSENEQQTITLGQAIADALPQQAVLALNGSLGAGKTRLVQAIAQHVGIDKEQVVSPTFVLLHEYDGPQPIFHFDAYRLNDDDEFLELGPEEYFARNGWTMIEWADRVERCLPREYLLIEIETIAENSRQFTVSAVGSTFQPVVQKLCNQQPAQ